MVADNSWRTVRPERTGWRDERISDRHRLWGWDCPVVDFDWLVLEYDLAVPKAIVEFKHERAEPAPITHPGYRALIHLANAGAIPAFGCRYTDDFQWFGVLPMNGYARVYLAEWTLLSERQWVELLYQVRGRRAPSEVLKKLG